MHNVNHFDKNWGLLSSTLGNLDIDQNKIKCL